MSSSAVACDRCGLFVNAGATDVIGAARVCASWAARLRGEVELHPSGRLLFLGVAIGLPTMTWLLATNLSRLGFKKEHRSLQLVTAITLVALPLVAALVSARLAAVGNAAFAYFVINAWQDRIDAHLANGGARAPLWKALLHAAGAAAVMAVVFLGAVALVGAPTS